MSDLLSLAEPENVPLDEIVRAMSPSQRAALAKLDAADDWKTAGELKVAGTTLISLWDFARSKRGIQPPIMLVTAERGDWDGKRYWEITELGRRVARSAEGGE